MLVKKRACIFLLVISALSLVACGVDSTEKVAKLNDEQLNTVDQPYWSIYTHNVTCGAGGYYYIDNNLVKYIKDDGESTVLCNKPDCRHDSADCAANLSSQDKSEGVHFGGYMGQMLYYHNGKVYVMYNEESRSGKVYLDEIAGDGSYRNRLFEIGSCNSAYALVFHDDDVYIYLKEGSVSGREENTAIIRKRSLDGKKDEIVYSYKDKGATVFALKSYGRYLYFLQESYDRDNGADGYKRKGLFRYEYATGNVDKVVDEQITDYTFDTEGGMLYYYVYNSGLYKLALSDAGVEKIYDASDGVTNVCQISYLNGNVYVSNDMFYAFYGVNPKESYISVISSSGELKNKVTFDKGSIYYVMFGDDKRIFINTGSSIYSAKLDNDSNYNWEKVE